MMESESSDDSGAEGVLVASSSWTFIGGVVVGIEWSSVDSGGVVGDEVGRLRRDTNNGGAAMTGGGDEARM